MQDKEKGLILYESKVPYVPKMLFISTVICSCPEHKAMPEVEICSPVFFWRRLPSPRENWGVSLRFSCDFSPCKTWIPGMQRDTVWHEHTLTLCSFPEHQQMLQPPYFRMSLSCHFSALCYPSPFPILVAIFMMTLLPSQCNMHSHTHMSLGHPLTAHLWADLSKTSLLHPENTLGHHQLCHSILIAAGHWIWLATGMCFCFRVWFPP